jgi:hypothetical protein
MAVSYIRENRRKSTVIWTKRNLLLEVEAKPRDFKIRGRL